MEKKWNIIPIKCDSKLPALRKGHPYLHKQYPKKLIKAWKENVAVVCGKTSNNLVIIDLDYRDDNKQYYRKIFSKYMEKYPKLAKTYIEETPNGHHLFYYIKGDKCYYLSEPGWSVGINMIEMTIVMGFNPIYVIGLDLDYDYPDEKDRINYKTFDIFKKLINENKSKEFGSYNINQIKLKKSELTPSGPIYSDLEY